MKRLILSLILSISLISPAYAASETKSSVSKQWKINWKEYGSDLYPQLKRYEKYRNCQGLQNIFNLSVQDNKAHAKKYGHNNVNLMKYIDHLLRRAKCYK